MRFAVAVPRLRFFAAIGLGLVLCTLGGTRNASANQPRRTIVIIKKNLRPRHHVPAPGVDLSPAQGLGKNQVQNIQVKGFGLPFWRMKGTITLRGNQLEVDGEAHSGKAGETISVAGRKFEILDFNRRTGTLKMRRTGWFGATNEIIALNRNGESPVVDFAEIDKRVRYNGRIWRRAWNWTPILNRLSAQSHNPIQEMLGTRTQSGKSAILRRTFFGGQTPEGIVDAISGDIFWLDLGTYYSGLERLGVGPKGEVFLQFSDGTWVRDRREAGVTPKAYGPIASIFLGATQVHDRLISVGRRLKPGHNGWMKLSAGRFWNQTNLRFTGSFSN